MDRRESIAALAGILTAPALSKANSLFNIGPKAEAYLMAHFMENDQKLYYAISHNARDWTALNKRKPVFDPKVNLRDPFIGRDQGAIPFGAYQRLGSSGDPSLQFCRPAGLAGRRDKSGYRR